MNTPDFPSLKVVAASSVSASDNTKTCRPQSLLKDAVDWRHVVDRFRADCTNSIDLDNLLHEFADGNVFPFLAPICAAWALTEDASLMTKSDKLRIAVLGAESRDTGLDGRIYSLLPLLLAKPNLVVEVELVGPNLKRTHQGKTSNTFDLPTAKLHKTTCGAWWKKRQREAHLPDLLIAFHPGLEEHMDEWMAKKELPSVLASGIPFVVFSFDLDEAERDAGILIAHGARVISGPRKCPLLANLYSNTLTSPPISFAGATFCVAGLEPQQPNQLQTSVAKDIEALAMTLGYTVKQKGIAERHSDAFRPCYISRSGELVQAMHVLDYVYFDPQSKELFFARNGQEQTSPLTPAVAPDVAANLASLKTALERAIYAAEIYSWFELVEIEF